MVRSLIVFFLILWLSSCDYSYHKDLGQLYVLRAVNSPVSMTIGYGDENGSEGLLPHTVYKIYWNKDFILALRHPSDGINKGSIDKTQTEYYLIDKALPPRNSDRKKGPFDESQKDSVLAEFRIDISQMEIKEFKELQ